MLEIRPAALTEFALLPAIEADADAAFEALDPPISIADFPAPDSAEDYADAFHIMVAGRPPAGFVRLEIVDGQAHMAQLSVSPQYARQGIGRQLVSAAIAWATEAGFRSMTLTTFASIPFNAPFYASCGFSELPHEQWTPELAELRNHEAFLDVKGARVVMRIKLTPRE